jgi:DNA-binding MurR/RpiR family transcriptional regulator/pimeloyl-ACP methyl ester carboxylesterase
MAILEQPPVPGQHSGVLEQIRATLSELSPSERRIGERILADPSKVIVLSINEFAQLCEVAQSTVSKFCRSISVPSYAALRLGLSHDFAVRLESSSKETPAEAMMVGIASSMSMFQSLADLPMITHALLVSTQVEIWSIPEFTPAGVQLADRLAAQGIAAANATVATRWVARCASLRPGSVVILLTSVLEDAQLDALARARQAGAQLLCCAIQVPRRFVQAIDWLIPLPDDSSPELVGFALGEVLVRAVQEATAVPGPPGPASPWQSWPHTRSLFLPTDGDPIPAILLTREDPPQPRPLILYFSGLSSTKEQALPGRGGTQNPICPRFIAALLNAGYHVLVVDAQAHGERKRPWQQTITLLRESFNGKGQDVLAAARADARFLVDGALALGLGGEQPAPALAVVGQSWGGLQTLYTLAGDTRIACGVTIMPVIHILHLPQFVDLEEGSRIVAGEPGAWMGAHLAPRPLLLISGGRDEIAPARNTQAFAEAIRPAYRSAGANQHLECIILPDVGHGYHERMVDEMLAWLARSLPAPHKA